jgi:hypothetical protein
MNRTNSEPIKPEVVPVMFRTLYRMELFLSAFLLLLCVREKAMDVRSAVVSTVRRRMAIRRFPVRENR